MIRKRSKNQTQQNMQDNIAKKAYEFYEKKGYQHGNDIGDWLEAERLVKKSTRLR